MIAMDLQLAVTVSMLPASRARTSAVFKAIRHIPGLTAADVLDALGMMGVNHREATGEALEAAERALKTGARAGMQPIPWFDPRYPPLLACIPDPPPVLWTKGNPALLARRAVAVIGSRAATGYALDVGFRLAGELAARGVVVVSGLARGVDSAAHRGCLDAGGATVAVLGSGLDRIYPAEHDVLAAEIEQNGLLLSELGPGGAPLPEHFPLRNRIISGISLAVVVVEASEHSGSLITARCAMEQGREVMAVPGSVLSGRNRGSHALLKDGAKVVETADDILEELGAWTGGAASEDPDKPLTDDPLLAHMDAGEPYQLDQLVERTGMAPSRLLVRLTELELNGQVARAAGGGFTRVVRRG
jgi:DNA processing protein